MSDESLLTAGAIEAILSGARPANPVLQVIGYKQLSADQMAFGSRSDEVRYRLMIGDGVKAHQYCIITNQELAQDIQSGKIDKWSIIRVPSYQTTDQGEGDTKRKILYILNADVVKRGSEVGKKLVISQTDVKPPLSAKNESIDTQPKPYPGMGGIVSDMMRTTPRSRTNEHHIIGIGELTPYIGKWVVKGRVTSKSNVREYNNAKGGGKLFNFTMADKSGEIKITAFNTDCERVFAYVEPNKVYLLGRATVKNADKRYTTADFEITLNSDSLLEEVIDSREADEVPLAKFNFTSIATLPDMQPNQTVDLIGAVHDVSDVSTILSKTKSKELKKRVVTIVDKSRNTIGVTIWGDQADTFTATKGDIFVTKSARLSTYGGRSVSAGDCIYVNPDIPEVRMIRNWHSNLIDENFTALTQTGDSGGSSDQWKNLEDMSKLDQVRSISMSGSQSGLYFKCKAILLSVGKNPIYKCCPQDGCGKKLVDTPAGELKCDKCQQTYSSFKYRYKTDIEISDRSGSNWVTLWDEKAEAIFKRKPEELSKLMKLENKDQYERVLAAANFSPFLFTLRARIDTYNNEDRVKLNVINFGQLDVQQYGRRLIEEIKQAGQVGA